MCKDIIIYTISSSRTELVPHKNHNMRCSTPFTLYYCCLYNIEMYIYNVRVLYYYYDKRASMTRSKVLAAFIIIIIIIVMLFAVVLLKRPCPSFGTRFCFPIITVFIIIILTHAHTVPHTIPYTTLFVRFFFHHFICTLFSFEL